MALRIKSKLYRDNPKRKSAIFRLKLQTTSIGRLTDTGKPRPETTRSITSALDNILMNN